MRRLPMRDPVRIVGVAVAALVSLVILKTAGMLISAIVLGLALGVALGGRIGTLASLEFRGTALFGLGVGVAILSNLPVASGFERLAYAASFWVLLAFVAANLRHPGATFVAAGLLAQAVVVTANGGAMPYSEEAAMLAGATLTGESSLQVRLERHSPMPFLGDVIPFPFNGRAYSLGDLLIAAGLLSFGLSSLLGARNRDRMELRPQVP